MHYKSTTVAYASNLLQPELLQKGQRELCEQQKVTQWVGYLNLVANSDNPKQQAI